MSLSTGCEMRMCTLTETAELRAFPTGGGKTSNQKNAVSARAAPARPAMRPSTASVVRACSRAGSARDTSG
jgi:hypothetical protein